jgi:hypothetical protein
MFHVERERSMTTAPVPLRALPPCVRFRSGLFPGRQHPPQL